MKSLSFALLPGLFFVLFCSAAGTAAPSMLKVDFNHQQFVISSYHVHIGKIEVCLQDRETAPAVVDVSIVRRSNEGVTFESRAGGIIGSIAYEDRVHLGVLRIRMENVSDKDRLCILEVTVPVSVSGGSSYWDGTRIHENPSAPTFDNAVETLEPKFPLSCIYDATSGYGLGISPDTLVSSLEFCYRPAQSKMVLKLKPVLFPKRAVHVSVVFCSFKPVFGKNGCLQKYYDAFPDTFSFHPAADKRIRSSCAHIVADAYKAYGDIHGYYGVGIQEWCRRGYTGWEWVYAPCRTYGDFYMRKEIFERYHNPRQDAAYGDQYNKKGYDWWLARKKKGSDLAEYNIAALHYITDWTDQDFMRAYGYDEAIAFQNQDVMNDMLVHPNWGFAGVNSTRAFLWNNRYAEKLKQDISGIFSDFQYSGIAWDEADSLLKYRKRNVISGLDGCAWDEYGAYVHQSVGQALLYAYIHSLTAKGYRPSIIGNVHLGGTYPVNFSLDGAILERDMCALLERKDEAIILRQMLGGKPLIQYHFLQQFQLGNYVDFKTLDKQGIRGAINDFVRYYILFCLCYGIAPDFDYVLGYEYAMKYRPVIHELMKKGWQPAPGMTAAGNLWLSRFGREEGSYLVVGNPEHGPRTISVAVLNEYLGALGKTFIHADYFGTERNFVLSDSSTSHSCTIGTYQPLVLKNICSIQPSATGNVRTQQIVGSDRIEYLIWLNIDAPRARRFVCEIPEDYTLGKIIVNDREIRGDEKYGRATFLVDPAAALSLHIQFTSSIINAGEKDILQFPFGRDDVPVCYIVIPEQASDEEKLAAHQIQEYFRYWYKEEKNASFVLPVITQNTLAQFRYVVAVGNVTIPSAGPGICLLPGHILTVKPTTTRNLQDVTWKLLETLDREYRHVGKIQNHICYVKPDDMTSPATKEMFIRGGLFGDSLREHE